MYVVYSFLSVGIFLVFGYFVDNLRVEEKFVNIGRFDEYY